MEGPKHIVYMLRRKEKQQLMKEQAAKEVKHDENSKEL